MSKVKSFDKNLYPSVYDAIYEIMDRHLLVAADNPIYHATALEDICFFLAENGIQHQYIITGAPTDEYDQIISLVWQEGASIGHEVWCSRGHAFSKNYYRVSLVVAADNNEEIVNWISNIDEVDVCDWSVEDA
jgi:hypothetical protein